MTDEKTTAYSLADWLGYLTRDEVDELKRLAKMPRVKTPVFINIGAGAGTSGLALTEARPEADIYTIDISPGGPLGGLESERNAFKYAELICPTQILADSKDVGKDWKLKVDLLFIDGDHSREGIAGDIKVWLPHVKRGGIVVFHDYCKKSEWGDVKIVVDDLMAAYKRIGQVGRIAAFKNTKTKTSTKAKAK